MSSERKGEDSGGVKRKAESEEHWKSKHRPQTYRTEWEKDPTFFRMAKTGSRKRC